MLSKVAAPNFQHTLQKSFGVFLIASFAASLFFATTTSARRKPVPPNGSHSGPRVTSELTGSVAVRDGERIRLSTDLGTVIVHTQNSGKLDYHIHLEADASQKDAQQLLKSFNISAHEMLRRGFSESADVGEALVRQALGYA